jgi:hypothetical protein
VEELLSTTAKQLQAALHVGAGGEPRPIPTAIILSVPSLRMKLAHASGVSLSVTSDAAFASGGHSGPHSAFNSGPGPDLGGGPGAGDDGGAARFPSGPGKLYHRRSSVSSGGMGEGLLNGGVGWPGGRKRLEDAVRRDGVMRAGGFRGKAAYT